MRNDREQDIHTNDSSADKTDVWSKREEAADDFWNIDRLMPDRPLRSMRENARFTPTAVDLELPDLSPSETVNPREPSDPEPVRDQPFHWAEHEPVTEQRTDDASAESGTSANRAKQTENRNPVKNSDVVNSAPTVHFVPPHSAEEQKENVTDTYVPNGFLLHEVRILDWKSNYHYFDRFSQEALRYHEMKPAEEVHKASFFSYFPQYDQLNRRQMNWYLCWREQVRNGQYPETDYAYVLLYLFELINLPAEGETAENHRDTMAHLWMAYRQAFPQLDHYMCEWLCDYCLIHHLIAPVDILAPALEEILSGARLKEFYLTATIGGEDTRTETARILLKHCCQYDYRKSKFAQGEHRALYDRMIPAAVGAVVPLLLGTEGQKPAITMLESTLKWDAYAGALCSYRNKRKIEVSYTSFSRSHELRFLIGDMVKYVENRLRGWIGVRSRLNTTSLPIPIREALDAYLKPLTPPKERIQSAARKKEVRPAYESLYDLPRKAVSIGDADAIEQASWETTRILTEAFGDDTDTEAERPIDPIQDQQEPKPVIPETEDRPPITDEPSTEPEDTSEPTAEEHPLAAALGDYGPFVRCALREDGAGQRAAAQALHKMADAVADEVNAITTEIEPYDILIEDNGTGVYCVIEDYRSLVEDALGREEPEPTRGGMTHGTS